jgi:hypothetical protein
MTHDCNCHGADQRLGKIPKGGLERPRYAPGLILEDSDLTAAVDYTRGLNRMLFRSLFGCGVICGLTVSAKSDCGLDISVAPGLALDGCGDPLEVREPVDFHLGPQDGVPLDGDPRTKNFWIVACAGEINCRPRPVVCDEDDLQDVKQATRTQATTRIAVSTEPPACECGCGSFRDLPTDAEARDTQLESLAVKLLPFRYANHAPAEPEDCCADPHKCQEKHRTDSTCPADCGCGAACACGCCVLLAWVHWFRRQEARDAQPATPTHPATAAQPALPGGWGVIHDGVRRSVRPLLMRDPIAGKDRRPGSPETGD